VESDSVRTTGDRTFVDLWINGRFRAITVSRRAIETFLQLPPDRAAAMTETDRREFVRSRMNLVVAAATERLRTDPEADAIQIDDLGGPPSPPTGDRRSGTDRRKGDRRKQNLGPPGGLERRR
jgi:hypothetical protein